MVPETCPEYQEGLWFERLKYHLKGGTRSPPSRGRAKPPGPGRSS